MPGAPRLERMRQPGEEFDLNLPPRTALACMSETMVLALEGRCEPFTLGRGIELEKVIEMEQMADRCGFKLAGMRAFDAAIGEDELDARRAAAAARRKIAV
ncbi:MAG: shikimate dehydrogenase, partial [Candidatus Eremiobacteraeota bacterium]|nr:shikimate dehydrogenase [Candidatus Eremiobacteraeota bacterium]